MDSDDIYTLREATASPHYECRMTYPYALELLQGLIRIPMAGNYMEFELLRNKDVLATAEMRPNDEYVVLYECTRPFDLRLRYQTFSLRELLAPPAEGSPLERDVRLMKRRAKEVEDEYRKWVMNADESIYTDMRFYDRWSMRRVPAPFVITGGDVDAEEED